MIMGYVVERQLINDVQAPRWLSATQGEEHAFLLPGGPIVAAYADTLCDRPFLGGDLAERTGRERCRECTAALHESARKVGKGLSEPQTLPVAFGSPQGDPKAGEARRLAEIDGAFERGMVKIPVKGGNGRAKLTEVPGTGENVRVALEYWKGRKPRTDASRVKQSDMVSELTRRLAAMGGHKTPRFDAATGRYGTVRRSTGTQAMTADVSPEGFTAHALPGPAIVQGPNMAARGTRPTWRNPKTGDLEPAAAYLDGSLTERLDRTVADPKPKARRTASQRKNWRRKQQRAEGRQALERVKELEAELRRARG